MFDMRKIIVFAIFLTLFTEKSAVKLPEKEELVPNGHEVNISLGGYSSNNTVFVVLMNVTGGADFVINAKDIPNDVGFIIVQIHTHLFNMSMTYDSQTFVTGGNVGLFYHTVDKKAVTLGARNPMTFDVAALLAVVAYTKNDPIPGGCNLVGDIKTSPIQRLVLSNATVTVTGSPPSPFKPSLTNSAECQNTSAKVEVYRAFLPEQDFSNHSYFETIVRMLTPSDIKEEANLIPESIFGLSSLKRVYSSYPGTGSVYAMIATFGNGSAAYVPIATYACNPLEEGSCQPLNTLYSKVLCAVFFFVGWFINRYGHNFFNTSMFYCSMLVGTFLCVAFSLYNESPSTMGIAGFSVFYGFLVFIIWHRISICTNSLLPSLLICGTVLGLFYFFLFYFGFQDEVSYLKMDWYFWMMMCIFVFIVTLPFTLCPMLGSVMCFATVGAFTVTLAMDYYFGSNLKYILINVMRRFTMANYNEVIVQPPYQAEDLLLTLVCGALAIWGMSRQFSVDVNQTLYQPSHATQPHLIRYNNERAPLLHQKRMTDGTRRRYYFYRESTY